MVSGSVWGEDFVLADRDLIRRTSGFALTYLEVLCLSRDKFFEVVGRREATCPQLKTIVRRYCVRMATHRGILAQALKLKRQRTPQRLGKSGSQESKLDSVKSPSSVPTPSSERCPVPPVPGTMPEELSPLRLEHRSPR
eukprot:s4738_g2.t1